ncbi:hypothetical protein EST38_g11001 [Candolleomyces aberdarensis]|uniref:Aldose 1-epimerase n=1 Tax=Candolleomyces aberdarensis TaxID=2316362 RepID=A0A4Q2D5Z3_9AGAR|nr:hypothetical protein EST38_g11001 [Candolleomyces aberdarensis]
MVYKILLTLLLSFQLARFTSSVAAAPSPPPQNKDWPFDVTELRAPDGSVTAKFVSIGATLTELWVKDKYGKARDVVLGYDDPEQLWTDPAHPVFNAIVGRYANRLKNGTFSIPISRNPTPGAPNVFQIPTNAHNGQVTLHGGIVGWDRRNWTLERKSRTSVTYKHIDAGHENWPGTVTAYATHTVENGGVLKTVVKATATEKTPIMLTQHTYWNLDAFQDATVDTVLDTHHLQITSSRVLDVDTNMIPTGKFINVSNTAFDFRRAQTIGARWDATTALCGEGCQGYDSEWIYDDQKRGRTSLWSDASGIRVDITSNQPAVQVYTSNWMNTVRKTHHGGAAKSYGKWSAVALEQQGYVAAVNTPEWGVDQICK